VTLESDDLEELTNEVRRLIESNRVFLERVNDEDYEDEDEAESDPEPTAAPDDYEEL